MNLKRTMTRTAAMLTALVLVAGVGSAQDGDSQRLVVPLTDPGSPATLKASVMSGSISVTAYDGNEIIVQTTMESDDREVERRDGLMRIPNVGVGLTIEELDNVVEVSGDWSAQSTRIEIQVPTNTSLELETVNGGDIVVEGVSGTHELQNVNGGIRAIGMSGTVVASTTNGDVEVSFRSLDAGTPMSFTTFNGDVNLTLPTGTAARLVLNSGQGEIYTDFDVELEPQQPKVTRDEGKRGYSVRIQKEVVGRINGGDTEFRMKTYNGDIFVRQGSG